MIEFIKYKATTSYNEYREEQYTLEEIGTLQCDVLSLERFLFSTLDTVELDNVLVNDDLTLKVSNINTSQGITIFSCEV